MPVFSFFSSAFSLITTALKAAFGFFIYRAGEKAEVDRQQSAALSEDRDARKIEDDVRALPDTALDDELRRPGTHP